MKKPTKPKKHPIQKIRKPMPPPSKVRPDKRKEEEREKCRKKVETPEEP
jgi:hypothetical protein